jgi:hypothetical protein
MANQKDALQVVLNIIDEEQRQATNSYSNSIGGGDHQAAAGYASAALACAKLSRSVTKLIAEKEGEIEPAK